MRLWRVLWLCLLWNKMMLLIVINVAHPHRITHSAQRLWADVIPKRVEIINALCPSRKPLPNNIYHLTSGQCKLPTVRLLVKLLVVILL